MADAQLMDSDRWISFHPSQAPPYEIGAWLTATLAYPEPEKKPARLDAVHVLAGSALRGTFAQNPEAAFQLQMIRPIYLLSPVTSDRRYASRRLEARLKHRLRAATLAGPMISQAIRDSSDSNAALLHKALLGSTAAFAQESPSQESANFIQRHFKPTVPVMHLAVAVALLIQHHLEKKRRITWPELLADQELVATWLASAEALETVALKCWPKLRPEHQYRFRVLRK